MDDLIDIFDKVADCEYKGEHYSARDNGAVMRHPKTPNRPRPLDNKWTFGKKTIKPAICLSVRHGFINNDYRP